MAAPCSESWSSWSRTRWRASRRTTEWALTVWSISEPGWAIEYMELDPSVRFSVMQLAHTGGDGHRGVPGFDQLGQALAGQVGGPGLVGRRGPVGHPHRGALHPELE